MTHGTFLHNTKIMTSKINEDRALSMKRDSKHARGRAISEMEMRQMILQYPEVHTNLVFESIPTMPLELRAGVEKFKFKSQTEDENGNRGNQYDIFRGYDGDGNVIEDGAHVGKFATQSYLFCKEKKIQLYLWRKLQSFPYVHQNYVI